MHISLPALSLKQRFLAMDVGTDIALREIIPHYIICNKSDWLKSIGYIGSCVGYES